VEFAIFHFSFSIRNLRRLPLLKSGF